MLLSFDNFIHEYNVFRVYLLFPIFPSKTTSLPSPFSPSPLLLYNQPIASNYCCHDSHGYWAIHWDISNLLRTTLIRKTDSFSLSNHQLSIAPQPEVEPWEPHPCLYRNADSLVSNGSCTDTCSALFIREMALSCPEDISLYQSFTISGIYNLFSPPLFWCSLRLLGEGLWH